MTTATPVYTARTLIASGTSNAAGAATWGTLDLRGKFGGLLTVKITNGGTGPTIQATAMLLIAHNDGATPAEGVAGEDWKTLCMLGANGVVANVVGEWSYPVVGAQHIEVEITGNTGQAVTCEAFFTELTRIDEA